MHTVLLDGTQKEDLAQAAHLLRIGKPVAFPTDTVYGLGANAQDEAAIQKYTMPKADHRTSL